MKFKVRILFIIIVCMAALSACSGKDAGSAAVNTEKRNVKVVSAKNSTITLESEFAGEIKPVEETGVISKVPGKVREVFVKVGDTVKKGDLLLSLDAEDMKAQLAQAESGVEVARRSLEKTSDSGFEQVLLQAQAEYDQAKLSYDTAKEDYDKFKVLYDAGAISKKDLDDLNTRLSMAKQRYDSAVKNLEISKGSSGPQSISIAKSQYDQAVANVQAIKTQMNNLNLIAPISGVITTKNVNVGEGVSSAMPAFIISDTSSLHAVVNIPEKLINKFYKGQKFPISLPSINKDDLSGEVDVIYPSIDSSTKNCKIKVKILNATEEVKAGMMAKIKLEIEKKENVVTVSNQAVITENGIQFIYKIKDGKVSKALVKVGMSNEKETEITEGLNPGEDYLVEGQSFLADGDEVNILERS